MYEKPTRIYWAWTLSVLIHARTIFEQWRPRCNKPTPRYRVWSRKVGNLRLSDVNQKPDTLLYVKAYFFVLLCVFFSVFFFFFFFRNLDDILKVIQFKNLVRIVRKRFSVNFLKY